MAFTSGRYSRRTVVRGAALGGVGLATAALIGCGSDDEEDEPEPTAAGTSASGEATAAATASADGIVQDPNLPYPFNFPEPATEPKAGGVMRVAGTWDTSTMDPTKSAAGGTIVVPNMVYNRLLGIVGGPDVDINKLQLEPELATDWERTPDGLTYTFHLAPNVKWQNVAPLNGRAFVAADAKFAYERYKTEGVHQSIWVNVESIEAVDDATLTITMKRAVADFVNPLGSRYQTIFPHELVDDGSIEKAVVGTGPMIFKEAVQSSHVSFDKNPDYWERPVLLDGFEFRVMPDHSARLAAFRAGQVEYAYSPVDGLSTFEQLKSSNPDVQINLTNPSNNTIPFGMNLSNPKFQDERVRQAIAMAIDRETMAAIVWEGLAKNIPMLPWSFALDAEPTLDQLGPYAQYNPGEAKALLAAAGAEGLTFENQYFAYGAYLDRYAEMLVPMFDEVGIKMTGGKVDYTQFNSQWVGRQIPEVTTSGWLTLGFDADNFFYNIVHSQSPGNRWNLNDPQMDEWATAQQTELDEAARREIHRQMFDYALEKAFWPMMPANNGFEVYQPWLRGIRFGGLIGSNSSYYDWGDQVAEAWLDK
jgi:peptide/nickel transport system substrate-binding protein